MTEIHSFHIPVMGIAYTIDTPLKVARYGINSVISLVDDILMEKLREMYCTKYNIPYTEISDKSIDYRASRITSYLNLINSLSRKSFEDFKTTIIKKRTLVGEYFDSLPAYSTLKSDFEKLLKNQSCTEDIKEWIHHNLKMGDIDVNIMTKVDKPNFYKGKLLSIEYNDAHAALRGYVNSDLSSSLVLSAGMNPRLFTYMAGFEDFFPNKKGEIKKKIILKVSDYRSALIQGNFLAKNGLWVSEYRIESGLNCGGHAFATEGDLMGPILAEFRDKRYELTDQVYNTFIKAITSKGKPIPTQQPLIKISAQGGVGTAEEHQFLLDHYKIDSVGWGSPFLLVPQATTVDNNTLKLLEKAKEDDLYLSNISPLGIPFNNLKGNTKDQEKEHHQKKGKPGSPCPKRYLALNNQFSDKGLCTASRQYQHRAIKTINETVGLSEMERKEEVEKIKEKSCICVGLGTAALLNNNINTKIEGNGVSICPGPNMAYFDKSVSLNEMINHIYGKTNIISRTDRPHMFIKELEMYVENLKQKLIKLNDRDTNKQLAKIETFAVNLTSGIDYYQKLFATTQTFFQESRAQIQRNLEESKQQVQQMLNTIRNQMQEKVVSKL